MSDPHGTRTRESTRRGPTRRASAPAIALLSAAVVAGAAHAQQPAGESTPPPTAVICTVAFDPGWVEAGDESATVRGHISQPIGHPREVVPEEESGLRVLRIEREGEDPDDTVPDEAAGADARPAAAWIVADEDRTAATYRLVLDATEASPGQWQVQILGGSGRCRGSLAVKDPDADAAESSSRRIDPDA